MTIRVLLADDQAVLRAGFRALIDGTDDLKVVAEASNGAEAVELARSGRPDVVLMDLRMPVIDGLAATRAIVGDQDLARVRVIILTTFEHDENVIEALRSGASGFLGKGVEPASLLDAIRLVARGEPLLSSRATAAVIKAIRDHLPAAPDVHLVAAVDRLTAREREVVALVVQGRSNDDVAALLRLSPLTVKTHTNRAMAKLGAHDRAQLVVLAYRLGLVRPGA